MKKTIAFLAAIAVCAACSAVYAVYGTSNEGTWPKSWPKELEPLRKQSNTYVGGEQNPDPVKTMSSLSPTERTLRLLGRIS